MKFVKDSYIICMCQLKKMCMFSLNIKHVCHAPNDMQNSSTLYLPLVQPSMYAVYNYILPVFCNTYR